MDISISIIINIRKSNEINITNNINMSLRNYIKASYWNFETAA